MHTILCFDYGQKKIGLAVGNSLTQTANELATIFSKNHTPDWAALDKIISEWQPDLLVIGLPIKMDGSDSKLVKPITAFGQQLKTRYNLPVDYQDERLSSNEANRIIRDAPGDDQRATKKRLAKRDQIAAKLVLESYFNRHE